VLTEICQAVITKVIVLEARRKLTDEALVVAMALGGITRLTDAICWKAHRREQLLASFCSDLNGKL
jgi:hypothetical protein